MNNASSSFRICESICEKYIADFKKIEFFFFLLTPTIPGLFRMLNFLYTYLLYRVDNTLRKKLLSLGTRRKIIFCYSFLDVVNLISFISLLCVTKVKITIQEVK